MKTCIDTSKEYGLVLEGGGAKGAFQIGAWKALIQAGVKITAIAGTSVGGLNGALIASGSVEEAESIWENMTYSKVMDVDDEEADAFLNGRMGYRERVNMVLEVIRNRGLDVGPLKELIAKKVKFDRIRAFPGPLCVVSFNVGKGQEVIDLRTCTNEEIRDYLFATSYLPLFRMQKTREQLMIDGGVADNVPVDVLLKKGYKDIIVIRLHGIGVVKPIRIPKNVNMITIAPEVDLGGILDFTKESAVRNMAIGYCSAMRVLYGLPGKIYFLQDSEESELDILNRLVSLADCDDTEREKGLKELLRIRSSRYRAWLEQKLPEFARDLSLKLEWSYRELWIAMLEEAAEWAGIDRFVIYAEKQLADLIAQKDIPEKAPEHTKILMRWLHEWKEKNQKEEDQKEENQKEENQDEHV